MHIHPHSRKGADTLKELIEASLDDDKADEIVTIDIADKCSFADYMIVASGRSQRHISSMAHKLQDKLKSHGNPPLSIEGTDVGEWVLIDAGDIIVHLFKPELRELYNIEKMWEVPVPALVVANAPDPIA